MKLFLKKLRLVIRSMKTRWYTFRISRRTASVGQGLKVNGKSSVTRNTYLGNNVNFNGMSIGGGVGSL